VLKHIIFDCDGVLWEGTNEGYVRCYHRAAVEAGIELDYAVARRRILANWGRSARREVEGMIPDHPQLVADVVERYRRLVRSDLFLSTAALIPGVKQTLESLSGRYGLSAITGMNADNLATLLARFELRSYLRHALSTGDSDDPSRQKHTGYHLRQVLDWEALAPCEVLCVGDAPVDVEMAQQVQAPIVVVLTGHLDQLHAGKLGVLATIPTVADLPQWIERAWPSTGEVGKTSLT
jgi:phosphoglycolate phosphatase-like HAD superfamily hydrolase